MPFKSDKQRKWMHANEPEMAKDWEKKKKTEGKRVTVKEISKWLKGLEEFRYRKVRGVDARRITSLVNHGLQETDLPKSLQKKWEQAKYGR